MCRPSCCKPPDQGAGIAAVAVIAAVLAAAKIGPAAARIWHLAVEALTIFTLTCATAAAAILVTWATARVIGSRRAHRQALPQPVPAAARQDTARIGGEPGCLACGGAGTVLQATGVSSCQDEWCPACQPDSWAG